MSILQAGMDLFLQEDEERKEKAKKRQEESRFPSLYFKNGDTYLCRFIGGVNPIPFYKHTYEEGRANFICPSKGACPMCLAGNSPSLRGMFAVLVRNFPEKDAEYKVIGTKEQVARLELSATAVMAFGESHKEMDFTNKDVNIKRTGEGKNTNYLFFPKGVTKLTDKEKKLELPNWEEFLTPASPEDMRKYLNRYRSLEPEEETKRDWDKIDI